MDGRRFISAVFSSEKAQTITQVVMNLPNDASEYLGLLCFLNSTLFFCYFQQNSDLKVDQII